MKKHHVFLIIMVIVLAVFGTLTFLWMSPKANIFKNDTGTATETEPAGAQANPTLTKPAGAQTDPTPIKPGKGHQVQIIGVLNGGKPTIKWVKANSQAAAYAVEKLTLPSLDTIVAHMKWGKIAFNTPTTMKVDETKTLQLVLSPSDPEAELKKAITEPGPINLRKIQWANRMEADLVSSGFKVTPITPKQQGVTTNGGAQWEWQIQAQQAGRQSLHLTLDALLKVDGEITPVAVQTFNENIVVQVTLPQRVSKFVSSNLSWVWTALILPVLGYLWTRWKGKKLNASDARPADADAHPAGRP